MWNDGVEGVKTVFNEYQLEQPYRYMYCTYQVD